MKPLYIYISLFLFVACIIAPSVLLISGLSAKDTRAAKLFDREEEDDTPDSDSETEKEIDSSEKIYQSFFTPIVLPEFIYTALIHYDCYQCFFLEPVQELITPPPRG